MKTLKLSLAAIIAMCLSLPLLTMAQQPGQVEESQPGSSTDREKMEFQQLDANKDGALSAEEAEQGEIDDFAAADRNQDEQISLDEYVYHARSNGAKR